jgi:3-hydroxyisobutyrate dehydrogenase
MKDTKRIGFVGLGRMGANMARCLREKGYEVAVVYDAREEQTLALARELNCTAAAHLGEVAALAEVVFTVVTDDDDMEEIFFGKNHHLLGPGGRVRFFLNCATLSPAMHRRVAAAVEPAGAAALEVSMASSIPQARAGNLFLMVAGKEEAFTACRDILEDLSKALYFVGAAGRAAEVKALVNMVMNSNTAALAEGLGLGRALGLDLGLLVEIFGQTGAASRVLETDGADMIAREHECYFSAEHAAKDSGIAVALARESQVEVPVAEAALGQFQRLMELGLGQLDKSAVAELTFPGRKGLGSV